MRELSDSELREIMDEAREYAVAELLAKHQDEFQGMLTRQINRIIFIKKNSLVWRTEVFGIENG